MLDFDGYNRYFISRTEKRGGGVAVHIKQHKNCEVLQEYTFVTVDSEVLCLKCDRELYVVVYRPPPGNTNVFLNFIEHLLEYSSFNQYCLLLRGDFIINVLDDISPFREFRNIITACGFQNVKTTPTRVTQFPQTALDLFIVSVETPVEEAGTISYDISDQCPILITYSSTVQKKNNAANCSQIQMLVK